MSLAWDEKKKAVMTKKYDEFLLEKSQLSGMFGFDPLWVPNFLFDFQKYLVEWAIRKGRAAIFADCGLGKTPMELVWASNVIEKTNKPVLIVTPLAVSHQFLKEGEKFGIEVLRSRNGKLKGSSARIYVTNYEQLEKFDPSRFAGVSADESSAIKHFDSKRKSIVTEFMRTIPYRLLSTATAAPNDYFELGTSSEAIGDLGFRDMITQFFKQETSKDHLGWGRTKYRFRGHAEQLFWRWVCSWARACCKPSDLGFDDERFILPELIENEIVISAPNPSSTGFFNLPPRTMQGQRDERRRTIENRCQYVAESASSHSDPVVIWCQLNKEADLLEELIPDAKQVSGSMSDRLKEERMIAFSEGQLRVLITKPKIGCFGLNWQHCSKVSTFISHSFEQYYQSVRRCWRFGQTRSVTVDIVATEGERGILNNLRRKSDQASRMFTSLVSEMNNELRMERKEELTKEEEVPSWL